MTKIEGKRILMFYPYGATKHYGDAIKAELEKRGARICAYDERPSQSSCMKIAIRLLKKKLPYLFLSYINMIIRNNREKDFDYILVCRGEAFTPLVVGRLREAFPKAKMILYLWDILRTTNVSEVIPYFDKAFSFDPDDVASNSKLIFRPTFFVPQYAEIEQSDVHHYDVMFVGTLHSNRYKIIRNFISVFEGMGLSFYVYLYVPSRIVYIKDWIRKFPYIKVSNVRFTPITMPDTVKVLLETKVVLDINYTSQKSLSMRAFEALAARRKYITTNPEIRHYDFYDERNILVIDLEHPVIPKSFIESPFCPVNDSILYKYSVSGLVDDLFDNL